ncbi:MAG: hypothetical protein M3203_00170 [Actinomycetota bacterium]|nr:hypothetical protein [Actinomycetota bacterium]
MGRRRGLVDLRPRHRGGAPALNALVFLGIAVLLSLAGCLVLWLRHRQPRSIDAHIRDFARELDALAPGSSFDHGRRSGHRGDRFDRPPDWRRRPG